MKESIASGAVAHEMWRDQFQNGTLFVAVTELSSSAQRAIFLRFWENYEIEEIANELNISWDQADQLLENALTDLKLRLSRNNDSVAA